MRQQAGLTLYLGALLVLIACARRKPDMTAVSNSAAIAILSRDNALANYTEALARAHDAGASRFYRQTWDKIARESLDQYFRHCDSDPKMLDRRYNNSPAYLDKRG